MISRRAFLTALGAGLCIGVYGQSKLTNEPVGDIGQKESSTDDKLVKKQNDLNPNVFIHISTSGLVSIVCHRSEMGQGIRSSLPVLLADELGADMSKVNIIQADGDKKYGDQNTDGSNSIRGIYEKMREAAAAARMMLEQAAAKRWKVSPGRLYSENNFVHLKGSKKKIAFGDLVADAAKLEIPKEGKIKLRPTKELKNLGTDLPLIDAPAYVNGKAQFGADIKIPDMLVAVIARPTVVGGKVKKVNEKPALAIKGVRKIIRMPEPKEPYVFQPWGGVAVLAEDTYSAIQGREALEVSWDHGKNASFNTKEYKANLLKSAQKAGTRLRQVGNVEKAMKSAARTFEASYQVPNLPHVSMEPPVAIAQYKKENGGFCEVWAPTQNPQAARTEVARVLGISEDKVAVHVTFIGGGFGRKSKADFCSEAAWLAREAGQPVRVQFTREDDIHNDYLNTINAQVLSAAVDEKGHMTAWQLKTAFPPISALFAEGINAPGIADMQQGVADLALSAPNVETLAGEASTHVRTGWLRSVYNIFNAFATNSFLDEIAHELKVDPLDFMLRSYSDKKMSLKELGLTESKNYGQSMEKHPVNGARLKNVLKRVAKNSNWKNRGKKAMGIAVHRSFLSYVGVVASVVKDKAGKLQVDEVWVTVDAGIVVNTDRIKAQMEGSVLNAMNHFYYGGVSHKDGAVEQSNFDDMQIVRMDRAPRKVHVDIVRSSDAPGGIGEPGVPPVAPAIANAIFALTGKRIREFASPELA